MGEIPENSADNKDKIVIYQLNDELAEFEELEIDEEEVKLYELLDPSFILLFLDPSKYKAWIWQGSEVSTRMKFISAKLAGSVRDHHGVAMKLVTADEGNEPLAFKIMVGLEEEVSYEEEQTGPTYKGTEEDLELLSLASRDKLILILEKIGLPEGYKRAMVIRNNEVFKYHVQEKEYMGKMIEEKQLIPLEEKEQLPDGPYLAEGYIPRMLFSFNKIVIIELLEKMSEEELAAEKEKNEQIWKQMEEERKKAGIID